MVRRGHASHLLGGHTEEQTWLTSSFYFEEPRIITLGLDSVPKLNETITRYTLKWLEGLSGKYSLTMVREFFAFYATIVLDSLPKGKKLLTQPRLTHMRVRG